MAALTAKQKKEYAGDSNQKVSDFLAERVEKIFSKIDDGEYKNIWNHPVFSMPYKNLVSGTMYNLENSLLLQDSAFEKDYGTSYYLTAKQGFAEGLSNKGEKSHCIIKRFGVPVGYAKDQQEQGLENDGEGKAKAIYIPAAKLTAVFNIAQFTGDLPERFKARFNTQTPKATPEELETVYQAVLETMPTRLVRVVGSNHYRPAADVIVMNPSNLFKSRLHELNTLLHEVSHSYGHESRKNRISLRDYCKDDKHRAYEELVANLSAQSVIKHLDVTIDPHTREELDKGFMDNHTVYDVSWARNNLKPADVMKAAHDADRTANPIIYEVVTNLTAKYKANPELPLNPTIKEMVIARISSESKPELENEAPKKPYKKSTFKRK
ncbi:zincin-like metallopeptidase domain-containing protein [Pseudomonas syringae]|uniref:zincin-like metallopeptidase domain-containing protein n=1 Tax=Pseudomonas syringae TaxID=317 RepID=UPI00041BB71B|nr:zincin-like metallopeptidase domain-containing protein [Pseudomonas syringae]